MKTPEQIEAALEKAAEPSRPLTEEEREALREVLDWWRTWKTWGKLGNSHVSSFRGNWWESIDYVFELDATSTISGVGFNKPDWSSTNGIHNNPEATYLSVTQAAGMDMDLSRFCPEEHGQVICNITTGDAYKFFIDTTKPQNIEPGVTFTVTVRNVSGGVIAAPNFHTVDFGFAPTSAPANGKSCSYTFRWNGTKAIEIGRSAVDVAN